MELARRLFIPGGSVAVLRAIAGFFSLIVMFRVVADTGYGAVLDTLANSYQSLVEYLTAPLIPVIEAISTRLEQIIGIEYSAPDNWQHSFVLMSVYLLGSATLSFGSGLRATGLVFTATAFLVSLAAALAPGFAETSENTLISLLALPLSAILGFWLFEFLSLIWSVVFHMDRVRQGVASAVSRTTHMGRVIRFYFRHGIVAMLLVLIAMAVPAVRTLPEPGLALLAILIIIYGFYHLWVASKWAPVMAKAYKLSRSEAFWGHGDARMGIVILAAFAWASVAIIADASFASTSVHGA